MIKSDFIFLQKSHTVHLNLMEKSVTVLKLVLRFIFATLKASGQKLAGEMVKKKVGLSFRYENYIYCLLTSIINRPDALRSVSGFVCVKIGLVVDFSLIITGF